MEQLELFKAKPTRPKPRKVSPNGKPVWTKYKPTTTKRPHQCDFCVLNCHNDVMAPIPRKARYIRRNAEGTLYLCLAHANDQRVIDGLSILRARAT